MINLYFDSGAAYVWNDKDWYELRTKYKICGALIGTVPSFPRQNDFLGLPLALMNVETNWLVKHGVCKLITLPSLTKQPNNYDDIRKHLDRINAEQEQSLRSKRIEQISQKIDVIVEGKRRKLIKEGKDANIDRDALLQEEINKLKPVADVYKLVQIPIQHPRTSDVMEVSCDELVPKLSNIMIEVFNDLHNRGYYITSGEKFGSNFLAYPGDPTRFHASHMIRCVDISEPVSPNEFVAFGRLAVSVNKLAMLATVTQNGVVLYQTIRWHDSYHG